MTEVEDERPAELETLEAIYSSSFVAHGEYSGCLELSVVLQNPLEIRCIGDGGGTGAAVLHLPPFRIRFKLLQDYPSKKGPVVNLKASWIPEGTARKLELDATSLWEEYGRMQAIYAYASHLEEAAKSSFGLRSLEVMNDVQQELLSFDRDAKRQAFEKVTYECGVCLTPKKGNICHQMNGCKHVFCIDCLQAYYNNAIFTGNIDGVKCPEFECGGNNERTQRTRLVAPHELLRIPIERPAVQSYVSLKRKRKLEADKSTVWCPRQWCQGAAQGNNYPRSNVPLEEMRSVHEDDIDTAPTLQEHEIKDPDGTKKQPKNVKKPRKVKKPKNVPSSPPVSRSAKTAPTPSAAFAPAADTATSSTAERAPDFPLSVPS